MDYTLSRKHLVFQLLPLLFIMIAIVIGAANFKKIRQFFVGALGQNIYGCGDNTIIDSAINVSTSTRIEQRDQPIIATINTSRKDLSEINLSNLYSHSGGDI